MMSARQEADGHLDNPPPTGAGRRQHRVPPRLIQTGCHTFTRPPEEIPPAHTPPLRSHRSQSVGCHSLRPAKPDECYPRTRPAGWACCHHHLERRLHRFGEETHPVFIQRKTTAHRLLLGSPRSFIGPGGGTGQQRQARGGRCQRLKKASAFHRREHTLPSASGKRRLPRGV